MPGLHSILAPLWLIIISLPAVIITGTVGFLLLLKSLTASRYSPLEPPPLPYLLPFFGHALSFVHDQRAFFEWANKKTNGNPFSMLIAGDKFYIFHSPDDVAQIFRKPSTLREIRINILDFKEADAAKIAELREHERQIRTAHLLTAEPLERTVTRYFEELDLQFGALDAEIAQAGGMAIKRVGFELVGDVLMHATVQALFGHDSFADYPCLFRDLRQFLSEHFFERIIGLPDFFARGAVRARERIKRRLKEVVASIEETGDVSGYILERVRRLGELGLSGEGVVSNEFDIILGSNLNSIPLTYLTPLHLLTCPSLPSSIRTELATTNFSQLSAPSRATLVPAGLPRLHALLREVLRYHTTAWSAREVAETTILELKPRDGALAPRVYELQKGGVVALPSSLLHHDPAIHVDPEFFNPERFLSDVLGGMGTPVSSATPRPFGGGMSYCPGRLFAEKQVVGFLAAFVARYDATGAGEWKAGSVEVPRNADFFHVTRQKGVEVVIRRRELGSNT